MGNTCGPCFNEALVRQRGIEYGSFDDFYGRLRGFNEALVRQRGIVPSSGANLTSSSSFNEALVRQRGIGSRSRPSPQAPQRFNEALVRQRGIVVRAYGEKKGDALLQ